ncbi:hypothetical protein BD410DRAFT_901748 [Rickenella mellea]|uniref:Uncharacterized protein n=1 Tax=Rickenella mellea TaxID=50990 RepID=A0A4Y7PPB8_9AGAM|nr:hypothetical protein BD410DRAFT_901748 [Rickenella mellea]
MHIQSKETFQSANTRNIEILQTLTYEYVRSLISVSEEPFQWATKSSERPLSLDEEMKRMRAEVDYFDVQINQSEQCVEVLRRALDQARGNMYTHVKERSDIKGQLESVLWVRRAKLPTLPQEILTNVCEQHQLAHSEQDHIRLYSAGYRSPDEICGIVCGQPEHASISVKLDEASLPDKLARNRASRLNVSISKNFSGNVQQVNPLTLQNLDTAIEFGPRWDRLSIDEDEMDAVDFVLRRCESVLPGLRVLDITEKRSWMCEPSQGRTFPLFIPDITPELHLQEVKIPLGYILHSKWLFNNVTFLSLCLPEKLDEPSCLADCLEGMTELRRLKLRAFTEFDVQSYAIMNVARLPKLMELELMFDSLDIDVLSSMLQKISCPNVTKYVTHFIPVFTDFGREQPSSFHMYARSDDYNFCKTREFAVDLWSFLDDRFPSLRDLTIGNHAAWGHVWAAALHAEQFLSILTEPAHGRWLFPQLSNLTLPVKSNDDWLCELPSGLPQLAVARAKQENVSDINSVTLYHYRDYAFHVEHMDPVESLKFYIPNLCFKNEL